MQLTLKQSDNLKALQELRAEGALFDLVELDGPYMAGLEDWDSMTEAQYIEHYAERLTVVRDVLQPWGVVFVFGYPEGCAEIKSWAHRTEVLYLRRWLTWYKQRTSHKGRKVETILFLSSWPTSDVWSEFKVFFRKLRKSMGLKLSQAHLLTGINAEYVIAGKTRGGGFLWFETETASIPTGREYEILKSHFPIPDRFDVLPMLRAYDGITEIDYFDKTYPEETAALNGNGLRSKPIGLYLDLFRPTIPPTDNRRALILYGGSGNAGIAAAALGYDVTMCELDGDRCDVIRGRWDKEVRRWIERARTVQPPLLIPQAEQLTLID